MDHKDYILQKNKKNIHFWFEAKKNLIYILLNSVYKNFGNRNILNIGSGVGLENEELNKFGITTALDIEENALNIAKKNAGNVILGDVEKINLKEKYYDCVCCFDVLEHLGNDQKTINKIYSSLKNEGYFIFTVPAFNFLFGPHDKAMSHLRRYNMKQINEKIKNANFKIIKLGFWNFFLFGGAAIIRIAKKFIFAFLKIKKNKSEAVPVSAGLNKIFLKILNYENYLINKNTKLPFGLSIFGIAQKK